MVILRKFWKQNSKNLYSYTITRNIIKLDDKQLNKESAKKLTIPYYFTEMILKVWFCITLETIR